MNDDSRFRATRGYLEARVRGASPLELVSLLYEALSGELRRAAEAVDRNDIAAKGLAICRSLDLVSQLRVSLDHDRGKEIATNLERVYVYWTVRLTDANVRSIRQPIDEIHAHVTELRSAWSRAMAATEPAAPPVPASDGEELRLAVAGGRSG